MSPRARQRRSLRVLDLRNVPIGRDDVANVVDLRVADHGIRAALDPGPGDIMHNPVRRPVAVAVDLTDQGLDVHRPGRVHAPAIDRHDLD